MSSFTPRSEEKEETYFNTDHIVSDLKHKAFQGATATIFSQVSVYVIQMAGVMVLARILTPEDFGLVAMVTSIDVFVRMFRNLGLMDAIVQKENITHKQVSTLFWINAAFGLFLTLFFMSLSPVIAWFFGDSRLMLIAILISLDYVFGGLSTQHRALLKRNLQMYKWAANEIGATALSFAIAIMLALHGWGYWAIVGRVMAFAIVQAAGSWIWCGWRPGLPARRTGIRPMLKFGRDMLSNNFLGFLAENVDKIIIGRFFGAQSLGNYSRAYHLFLAPAQQLSVPLTSVAVATLSRLQDDHEKYRRFFLNAMSMVAFVAFPVSGFLTLAGRSVVRLLLGPQWGQAGTVFCVFAVGIGIHMVYATHYWLHMSLGRTDRLVRWSLTGSACIIASFLIGSPFGPTGMAAAYTIAMHLLILPCLWYAGKPAEVTLSSVIGVSWRYYLSALLTGFALWLPFRFVPVVCTGYSGLNTFTKIVLVAALYVLIYVIFVIALHGSTQPISQFVKNLREMLPKSRRGREA
jgi:PST family polysaccharide transporter